MLFIMIKLQLEYIDLIVLYKIGIVNMKFRYILIIIIAFLVYSLGAESPPQPGKTISEYLLDSEGFALIKAKRQGSWLVLANLNLKSLDGLNSIPDIKNVKVLALYNNPLKHITADFLYVAPNLQTLTLNNTQLESIEPNSFAALKQLKNLSLADNPLKTIPAGTLNGLDALTDLDLSNTQLTHLDTNIFAGTPNLEILYLNNNQFRSLDPAVFAKLSKLKSVNLMKNPLTEDSKKAIRKALEPRGVKVIF